MSADNVLPFAPPGASGAGPGTRFRSLDLTDPQTPERPFSGVSARFGSLALINDAEQADRQAHAVETASPSERPQARVVRLSARRVDEASFAGAPPQSPPMPLAQAYAPTYVATAAPRRQVWLAPAERKTGFRLAVILMFAAWAGLLALGAVVFNTPGSGMKIEWRR